MNLKKEGSNRGGHVVVVVLVWGEIERESRETHVFFVNYISPGVGGGVGGRVLLISCWLDFLFVCRY